MKPSSKAACCAPSSPAGPYTNTCRLPPAPPSTTKGGMEQFLLAVLLITGKKNRVRGNEAPPRRAWAPHPRPQSMLADASAPPRRAQAGDSGDTSANLVNTESWKILVTRVKRIRLRVVPELK